LFWLKKGRITTKKRRKAGTFSKLLFLLKLYLRLRIVSVGQKQVGMGRSVEDH